MVMRLRYFWILLALVITTSCDSYEEQQKVENVLTQSVAKFHDELNKEQFHDIYLQATPSLRQRVDEARFTTQLKTAHEQLGTVSGKASVRLTPKTWKDLQWARFFGREQIVVHGDLANSDLINASERFEWKLENEEPKLNSYEFRFICKKPCAIGIGPS